VSNNAVSNKAIDVVDRRRRVAMAGHQGDEAQARRALDDPEGDVRATALGALHRMGRLSEEDVAAGLADPTAAVRRRACEVSDVASVARVRAALDDLDPLVVEAACFALGERLSGAADPADNPDPSVPKLVAVATGHRDPLCREAAIAALGAIGHPAGLDAILAALDDKPAVRRRAVIALAPFDGPAVDAGLARARLDRDWQVRQAAEDLSSPTGSGGPP
jgi:HEAT repeat protein